MKSTIITLGIAGLCCTTAFAATAASGQTACHDKGTQELANSTKQINWVATNQEAVNSGLTNNSEETVFFSPTAVLKVAQGKSIEETVRENKLITESQEQTAQPLSIEKTQRDYINEDNQIIESHPNVQAFPLALKAINHRMKNKKAARSNHAAAAHLKA